MKEKQKQIHKHVFTVHLSIYVDQNILFYFAQLPQHPMVIHMGHQCQ